MDGLSPLVLEVWDKDFAYQGTIARPQALSLTARHNAVGGGAFALDADDDAVEALIGGAFVTCMYRHDPENPLAPMYFLGGPVQQVGLGGTFGAPLRTFTVGDHWNMLMTFPCRGVPASSGWSSQGTEASVYSTSGPAETVVKDLMTKNLSLVPTPITVVPTHGWGENIAVQVRSNALGDKIFPALNYAHVGISLQQTSGGLTLDAYLPQVHTVPLTVDSGVVASASGEILRPTVSRVTVRKGDGTFLAITNTAVEAVYGYCGWSLVDVSESSDTTYCTAKGWEVLNAGAVQASVSLTLMESDDWRVGQGDGFVSLGDEMPVLLPGMTEPINSAISETEIGYDVASGLRVEARVGERAMSPDQVLAKALRQVAARQRITQARG